MPSSEPRPGPDPLRGPRRKTTAGAQMSAVPPEVERRVREIGRAIDNSKDVALTSAVLDFVKAAR